jgi:hypothetical protein
MRCGNEFENTAKVADAWLFSRVPPPLPSAPSRLVRRASVLHIRNRWSQFRGGGPRDETEHVAGLDRTAMQNLEDPRDLSPPY